MVADSQHKEKCTFDILMFPLLLICKSENDIRNKYHKNKKKEEMGEYTFEVCICCSESGVLRDGEVGPGGGHVKGGDVEY